MHTHSPVPAAVEAADTEALNQRLCAEPVDADCLAAALLLRSEQQGISRMARSCGLSNATFRRQFRSGQGLPLATLVRVLHSFGLRLHVARADG